MTTHETAREVWSNRKSGAARMALMLEGDPNLDQGGWRVWIGLATGGTIKGDDAIVNALVDAGVDADAARTAVEEGRFAALGDPATLTDADLGALADQHEDDRYEQDGEAAYGRED